MFRPRLIHIDFLRGLAILLMTVDHARDGFHPSADWLATPMQLDRVSGALFLTRWLTHFCAPSFVLLAGLSIALMELSKGMEKKALARFLLERGMALIVIDITIVRTAFVLIFDHPWLENWRSGVVSAIGVSFCVMAALIFLPRYALWVLGFFMAFGHNLLDGFHVARPFPLHVLWSVLHEPEMFRVADGVRVGVFYPFLPWMGVTALGYAMGRELYSEHTPPDRRRRALLSTAGIASVLFLVLRASNFYGEPFPFAARSDAMQTVMAFLNLSKYPPSALFLLMTLTPLLLGLASLEGLEGGLARKIALFGSVPLFFYVTHLYLIEIFQRLLAFALGLPANFDIQSLAAVWGLSLVIVLVLFPPCRWYFELKRRTRWRVLSYL